MLQPGSEGFALGLFAVMRRGNAEFVLERPAEMRHIFETAIQGDLGNVESGVFQQHGGVIEPFLQQPLAGRIA